MPSTSPIPLSPRQWTRLAVLLQELLTLPAEQRARALRGRPEDARVSAEVESLIAYADRRDVFLDHPPSWRGRRRDGRAS